MTSVDGYGVQKEGQEESKIQKETDAAEVERVKCDGNEDWCGLKRKLIDVAS